jgi:TonB family protein
MRTASFFFISAALHAAALGYPALLKTQAPAPIAVTLVESGEEGGGGVSGGEKASDEKPAGRLAKKPITASQALNRAPAAQTAPREAAALAAAPEPIALPVLPNEANGAIEVPARVTDAAVDLQAAAPWHDASGSGLSMAYAANKGGGGGSGDGSGSGRGNGTGIGSGDGSGAGDGDGNGAGRFVQASYASCPKADLPEAAKREGQEGKVTVLVLVDEEGRPKSSRVLESSGFALLDRAAVDNIQRRCRFHPAHRGENKVETSIKIPVEFRFADSKAH